MQVLIKDDSDKNAVEQILRLHVSSKTACMLDKSRDYIQTVGGGGGTTTFSI